MVLRCFYCTEIASKENGRTLHKFPLRNTSLLKCWLEKMNIPSLELTASHRLCSNHFEPSCLQNKNGKTFLSEGSIPQVFGIMRGVICVVCGEVRSKTKLHTFHRFPCDPQLHQAWKNSLHLTSDITNDKWVCSKHFGTSCFEGGQTHRLKRDAVPYTAIKGNVELPSSNNTVQVLLASDLNGNATVPDKIEVAFSSDLNGNTLPSTDQDSTKIPEVENTGAIDIQNNTSASIYMKSPQPLSFQCQPRSDHVYEKSREILQKQLTERNRKINSLQRLRKLDTQKIRRMKKKIASLKDVVNDLRKRGAFSESGLSCLQSATECSVSEFLQRFSTNYQSSEGKQFEKKKKGWTSIKSSIAI